MSSRRTLEGGIAERLPRAVQYDIWAVTAVLLQHLLPLIQDVFSFISAVYLAFPSQAVCNKTFVAVISAISHHSDADRYFSSNFPAVGFGRFMPPSLSWTALVEWLSFWFPYVFVEDKQGIAVVEVFRFHAVRLGRYRELAPRQRHGRRSWVNSPGLSVRAGMLCEIFRRFHHDQVPQVTERRSSVAEASKVLILPGSLARCPHAVHT